MTAFLSTETLVIELLLIVSLVAIGVRQLRVPYTVALVVVGLVLTVQQPFNATLVPEVILALLVPPLVFEAAFHLNLNELQRNIPSILLYAVPGVILATLIVGGALVLLTPLSLPVALVFGALISATDPVSVVALFRSVGVPKRLALLVEGESLFNDGTAIVLFDIVLAVALTGHFDLVEGIGGFVRVAVGGTAVGVALGWLTARLISRVDDYLIETTLTTVLAYGSYVLAQRLGFSGVLAVVAAGLVNGNFGPRGMSPTTRIVLFNFWEYLAFLANSLIFLLIGLQINVTTLAAAWQPVLAAIVAVLVARAVVVYGLGWFTRWLPDSIPLRWQHILNWGGLRGAIGLALALSLPAELGADTDLLRLMAYGVVLFTLLVQSTTMRPLLRRLKIIGRQPAQIDYELRHARLTAFRAAAMHLDEMHDDGLLSTHVWEQLRPQIHVRAVAMSTAMREFLRANPILEAEEMDRARRELLRAQRAALQDLRRDEAISEEVFEQLVSEIDIALDRVFDPTEIQQAVAQSAAPSADESTQDTPKSG